MDPILFGFLITAVFAVVFLILVNIYLYREHHKEYKRKDVSTQTIRQQCTTVSTHTIQTTKQEKGHQYPKKRTLFVDQGCDAQPVPHGAVVTEQVKELRATQSNLQDYMRHLYSRSNTDLEKFMKEVLEQSIIQCQMFQAHRDDLLTRLDTLKEEIQRVWRDTQTDLHKVQETVQYKVQRSTHNIVHQLLSIPPPPPPPPRPWLYLPYGCQTRLGEAYKERKACQDHFWSQRCQMNVIVVTDVEQEEGATQKKEQEDAQSLD